MIFSKRLYNFLPHNINKQRSHRETLVNVDLCKILWFKLGIKFVLRIESIWIDNLNQTDSSKVSCDALFFCLIKLISYLNSNLLLADDAVKFIYLVWRRISTESVVLILNTEWRIIESRSCAYDKNTQTKLLRLEPNGVSSTGFDCIKKRRLLWKPCTCALILKKHSWFR